MHFNNSAPIFERSIAQVLTSDGQIGTAFAVHPDGLLLTCRHVVSADCAAPPAAVSVRFNGSDAIFQATVDPLAGAQNVDLALLRLHANTLPKGVKPLPLHDTGNLRGQHFRVYGYPAGYDETGRWGYGKIQDPLPSGLLQVNSKDIRGGYSGGPVQELRLGRVVGVIASTDESDGTSVVIPSSLIRLCFEHLPVLRAPGRYGFLTEGLFGLPGEPLMATEQFLEEYLGADGKPVAFGGRSSEIGALDSWLETSTPFAILTAPAGRGKSSLSVRWASELALSGRADVAFVPCSARFGLASKSMCFAALGARIRYLVGAPMTSNYRRPDDWWLEVCHHLESHYSASDRKLLVVLDGLDEALDWSPATDLRFPSRLGDRVKVLLTGRAIAAKGAAMEFSTVQLPLPQGAHRFELSVLTYDGVLDVVQSSTDLPLLDATKLAHQIHRLSGGDPLIVRLYLESVRHTSHGEAFLNPESLDAIVPGLDKYFEAWWSAQELRWKNLSTSFRAEAAEVLNILSAALGPIDRDAIAEIAGLVTLKSWAVLDECLKQLNRFVVYESSRGGFSLGHPMLAEFFRSRMTAVEKERITRQFEAFVQTKYALLVNGQALDRSNAYAIRYLGPHFDRTTSSTADIERLVSIQWLRSWTALEGGFAGFLSDVDRVWSLATKHVGNDDGGLGLQLRCAAVTSAIVSIREKITPEVLHLITDTGVVSVKRSLGLAISGQDPMKNILELMPFYSLEEQIRGVEAAIFSTGDKREEQRRFELLRLAGNTSYKEVRDLIETAAGPLEFNRLDYIEIPPPEYLTAAQAVSAFNQMDGVGNASEPSDLLANLARWAPHFPEVDRSAAVEEMFVLYPKVGLRLAYEAMQRSNPALDFSSMWRILEQIGDYDRCISTFDNIGPYFKSLRTLLLDNGIQGTRAIALANMALAVPETSIPRLIELTERFPSERWRLLSKALISIRLAPADRLRIQQSALKTLRAWDLRTPVQVLLSRLAYQFVPELVPQAVEIAESLPEVGSRIEMLVELAEAASIVDRHAIAEKVLHLITTVDESDALNKSLYLLKSSQLCSAYLRILNSIRLPGFRRKSTTDEAYRGGLSIIPLEKPCVRIAKSIEHSGDEKDVERIVRRWIRYGLDGATACWQELMDELSNKAFAPFLRNIGALACFLGVLHGRGGIETARRGLQFAAEMFRNPWYPTERPSNLAPATTESYAEFKRRIESYDVEGLIEFQLYRPRLSRVQYVRQVLGFKP